jgi:hypothetical protein
MNSVKTFKPIWVFVTAWIMPIGRAKPKEMAIASKKAHQERLVG